MIATKSGFSVQIFLVVSLCRDNDHAVMDEQADSDPNDADTDGDTMSDGEESVAGGNPRDAADVLALEVSYDQVADEALLQWPAHGGKTYQVYYLNDVKVGLGGGIHDGK